MKTTPSKVFVDSLEALPKVDSQGALRSGLAAAMIAIRDGDISAAEGKKLIKAVKLQRKKITKSAT